MKVLETRDAFLSDYEVLQFLSKLERRHHWDEESSLANQKSQKKIRKNRPYNNPLLQSITKDTIAYLTSNKGVDQEGDANVASPITRLDDEKFSQIVRHLNEYPLFKAEKLQIVNQLPQSMVHMYSVVEECDSRFTQEEMEALLSAIAGYI